MAAYRAMAVGCSAAPRISLVCTHVANNLVMSEKGIEAGGNKLRPRIFGVFPAYERLSGNFFLVASNVLMTQKPFGSAWQG